MQGITVCAFDTSYQARKHQLPGQGPEVTPSCLGIEVTPQLLGPAVTPDMFKSVLPQGCSLDFSIIGQHGLFGLVFKCNVTHRQGCGVWTGQDFRVFEAQQDEKTALDTVLTALNPLGQHATAQQQHQQQQTRTIVAGATAGTGDGTSEPMSPISCLLYSNFTAAEPAAAAPAAPAPAAPAPAAPAPAPAPAPAQLGELPAAATGSRGFESIHGSYNSKPSCTPTNQNPVAYRGPLLPPTALDHVDNNCITKSFSARLASCDLSEALSLAQQAAAEQGISDLAAALKQMSSSSISS